MRFVSWAQNFEDVMLWRALGYVEQGFYIDVGANDPDVDSVTKAFYDRGWHGINIEPVCQWHEKLQNARPRDLNLKLAAGACRGEVVFYDIPSTGISTSRQSFADDHAKAGYESREIKVPADTLTNICEQHAPTDINFLKIDAEGSEKNILAGLDINRFRPWIILVEAIYPNPESSWALRQENFKEWEDLLLVADYSCVWDDGLNHFYLAREQSELSTAFRYPPGLFDHFITSTQAKLAREIKQMKWRILESDARCDKTQWESADASCD